jgi:arsenite/tail-anchored protein-transporting ATPase
MNQTHTLTFLTDAPRHLFFTGKGGVGKTSLACASALALADAGKRVLLVSTDPASNLQHVFETGIGQREPTAIPGTENLFALNIDPESAAQAYRDRVVGPVRGLLPEASVREMEEQLSGACTTEIAAFDEFTMLLTDPATTAGFDHVVFDTAPTGHTLRLLSLPNAWSGFLDTNTSGTSCLGPLAGLDKQRQQYKAAVDALADGSATTLILVSRPQQASLAEAARTSTELAGLGIRNQRLAINGLMPAAHENDPLAVAMAARDKAALENLPLALQPLPTDRIELQPHNLIGVEALRALVNPSAAVLSRRNRRRHDRALWKRYAATLSDLVAQIEQDGHGLIMVMGKGGVGKTTLAAAVAVELARRGHDVNLTTTDPAAHVTETVASETSNDSTSAASIPPPKPNATGSMCWRPRARIWTKPAASCSKKICAPPAPRRSPSSRPFPRPFARPQNGSS